MNTLPCLSCSPAPELTLSLRPHMYLDTCTVKPLNSLPVVPLHQTVKPNSLSPTPQLFGNPLDYLPELSPCTSLRSLSLANVRIMADLSYTRQVSVFSFSFILHTASVSFLLFLSFVLHTASVSSDLQGFQSCLLFI